MDIAKDKFVFLPKISINPQSRKAFLSALLVGFIAHLYQMTNMLSNDDTNMISYSSYSGIMKSVLNAGTGRWLTQIAQILVPPFRTPLISGVVILLLMSVTAALIADTLKIESPAGAVFTGVFIGVSPTVMAYMSLYDTAYPVGILLAVFAVWVTDRKKYGWVIGTVCLCISLAIFPVNISAALILIVYKSIKAAVSEENFTIIKYYNDMSGYIKIILFGGAVFLIATFAILFLTGTKMALYQGADQVTLAVFLKNFPGNCRMIFENVYHLANEKMEIMPELHFAVIISYVIQIACVVFLFFKNRIYKNISQIIILVLSICMLPFSLCTMTLLSNQFRYNAQHRMAWTFLFVGMLMLVEPVAVSISKFRKQLLMLTYAVSLLISYGFFLFCNIGYFNQQYVMEKDQALTIRILEALDQEEGFDYDTDPVYFLNICTETTAEEGTCLLKYDTQLYNIMFPDTETNLWCYGDSSFKYHIRRLEGIEFADVPEDIQSEIEKSGMREEYKTMKPDTYKIVKFKNTNVYIVIVHTLMPQFGN